MTANVSDNNSTISHFGVYGNDTYQIGTYANLATASAVAGDTFDFVKIPAGATVISGFIYSTQMTGTSTWVLGIKSADGTSSLVATGTGTAVLVAGTASALTGSNVTYALRFLPFTNDVDTIAYATHVAGPAHTANDNVVVAINYVANGTK